MLEETLFRATGRSMQSAMESICKGYVSLPGGGRLGVAGTASIGDGQEMCIRDRGYRVGRMAVSVPVVGDLPAYPSAH